MTTPNLLLPLPDVQVTTGPQWATLLNESFELLDTHDHTTNKGVRVPSAGININGDLSFEGYNAIGFRSLRLDSQGGTIADATDLTCLFVKNGELAYIDALGNEVVMTASGSVAGATGSITGLSSPASAVFSSITNSFTFSFDSSKPAKLNVSDIGFYEYDNASANPVTIKSPAAVGSAFSITLPVAQASAAVEFLTINNSGQLNHATLAGTANQVTVTQSVTAVTLSLPQNIDTAATPTFRGAVFNGATEIDVYLQVSNTTGSSELNFGDSADNDVGRIRYDHSADRFTIRTGATDRVDIDSTGLDVTGSITATTSISTLTSMSAGTSVASTTSMSVGTALTVGTTVNIAGGGAFKVTVLTGSIAGSASSTIFTGATVYSATGWANGTNGLGDTAYGPISANFSQASDDSTSVCFTTSGISGDSSVRIRNTNGSSRNYRVVVIHA